MPVRLDPDTKLRLKNAAEVVGITVSALIRLLVESFVKDYDRKGGKIILPLRVQIAADPPPQDGPYDNASTTPLRKAAEEKRPYSTKRKTLGRHQTNCTEAP